MPRTGLEPARLSARAPETRASTIPPPGQQSLFHRACAKRIFVRAENEARTRDPNLGKVVLYQLSYFRICITKNKVVFAFAVAKVDIFRKLANK